MEDLELISLLNECNKMSVLEVSNYLLGKMDYLSRIKSDKSNKILTYIIHSGFISGYQNRYGDNLKPPTNVYHRMTA